MNIQLADILPTIRFNQGHMPTHELAMMLGKRHSDVVNKLKAECEEDGEDWGRKFRIQKVETSSGKGRVQTYTSYLLEEEDAVSLAMSYDRKLAKLIYRAFKSALEVVDAVNAGEDPAIIAQKAEEATLELLFKSVVSAVCGKVCVNTVTKPKREAIMKCLRMVTVQMGGVLNAKADIVETQRLFAVQAKLADIPLYAHYAEKALAVIDKAVLEDKRKVENWKEETVGRFSSW